jgi:hypothetical protein
MKISYREYYEQVGSTLGTSTSVVVGTLMTAALVVPLVLPAASVVSVSAVPQLINRFQMMKMKCNLIIPNFPQNFKELTKSNEWMMLLNPLPFQSNKAPQNQSSPSQNTRKILQFDEIVGVANDAYEAGVSMMTSDDPWMHLIKVLFWTAVVVFPLLILHTLIANYTKIKFKGTFKRRILLTSLYMYYFNIILNICARILRTDVVKPQIISVVIIIFAIFPIGLCVYVVTMLIKHFILKQNIYYEMKQWQGDEDVLDSLKLFVEDLNGNIKKYIFVAYVAFTILKNSAITFLLAYFEKGDDPLSQVYPIIGFIFLHLNLIVFINPFDNVLFTVQESFLTALELGTYVCSALLMQIDYSDEMIENIGKLMIIFEMLAIGIMMCVQIINIVLKIWNVVKEKILKK